MKNQPIRILHWGLTNARGGVETFIMELYRNIDRNKVQFDFLEDHNMREMIYEDEINQMGGRIYRILYSKKDDYKKSRKCLIDFLKEHKEIVGVHVHANFLYGSLLRDAKKAGIPIRILHSHSSCLGVKEGIKKKIRNAYERILINKYPTEYFACSDLAADYMFPNKDYKWIKNGIHLDEFNYSEDVRNSVRKQLNIKDETIIGFVGNLREEKNLFYIIDIFEQFNIINKDSKLMIVGTGRLEDKVKEYVYEKKLDKNVIFLGLRKDVNLLYQAMDAFLLPSFFEGLPVVLVEAQASGLPCFVSDFITKQIKVTDNIIYKSINLEPINWANDIYITLEKFKRVNKNDDVMKAGFYMPDISKELEDYYISTLEKSIDE